MEKKRVAILGMSFRLPGTNRESFWPELLAGRNLVTRVPEERWAHDQYLHPRKSHPGTSYTFAAGSIGDISEFDAEFFGISPREAAQMDPQQRLLLELSWEAFENAGVRPSDLRGGPCGVFVGVSSSDYALRLADDLAVIDSGIATGTASSITANRISYALDLRGPSLAVDTACSSSLVAFHLACGSIMSGECTHALTAGISLHAHPYGFVAFSKASMLSPRGVCNVFDAAGDGYVRSEGCGVFLLKDYERARLDGDRIIAVVGASAINSDGRKSGLTVPSAQAQAALLRKAYANAGINPEDIDYLEAHGTGTAVGDPIETRALGEALGALRSREKPLLIGSVKSNLGHLEAAAGMAGLVKAMHCIEHRVVPATIGVVTPNPNIRLDEWNLKIATENVPLKEAGRLVIGVNSFGFGGANAHVVLESPEQLPAREVQAPPSMPVPVVVSGRSAAALQAAARDLSRYLESEDRAALYDIAWTASFHRDWHSHRAMFLADSADSLAGAVNAFSNNARPAVVFESGIALGSPTGVAFVYTGNGSQWEGMGRKLLSEEPAFRDAVRLVDGIFRPLSGHSLEDELEGRHGAGRYVHTEISQPALFAVQVGITEVLRSRGVNPDVVCGHSVGEVAAAWACGALTLEQAVTVIYHRSRLQGQTKGRGQMTAIALGQQAVAGLLESLGLGDGVSIAAINDSRGVTVAGEARVLDTLEVVLDQRRISYKRLDLDYAFHSPAMDGIQAELLRSLAELRAAATAVPFRSTVTGEVLDGAELDADYWWRNIREPVRFEKAIKGMLASGVAAFVEIGPQALLRGYISACMRDEDAQGCVVPTMLRNEDGAKCLWSAVFRVAISGAKMDWRALFPAQGNFVALPNYPWQRERYWHAVSPNSHQRLVKRKEHPLLGIRLQENEWTWENQVDARVCGTLVDHVVGDAVIMPGSAYAEMALAAARLWHGGDHVEIEHLEIQVPMELADAQSRVMRFSIDSPDGSFTIRSRDLMDGGPWMVHAVGRIPRDSQETQLRQPPVVLPARSPDFSGEEHYALTRAVGLDYGPAFRAITSGWVENGYACAQLVPPEGIGAELGKLELHPALLDCAFQLIFQVVKEERASHAGMVYVPVSMAGLRYRAGGGIPRIARATLHRCNAQSMTASFALYDAQGEAVAWIREARFHSLRLRKNQSERLRYLEYHCVPRPHPLSPVTAPRLLQEVLGRRFADLAYTITGRGALKRYTEEIEPLLDGLCARFAARALKSLAPDGRTLRQEDVMACANANPEIAPLLSRLIGMLEEDKLVLAKENEWQFLPEEDSPAAEDIWNSLLADHPAYVGAFHAVGRVGMHLEQLLRGRRSLEQLLPRECTPGGIARPLLEDAGLFAMQSALQDVIGQTLRHLPHGKRIRIIEVGADRPSFAANVARVIDFDRCDYVFATLAATVPEQCHRLQEAFPNLEIRQIHAEEDHADVPAAGDQFHLAVMTADAPTDQQALLALAYVKRNLAPGAAVLVVERHPSRWMDFVFGGRRTWWRETPNGTWASRHRPAAMWRQQMQKLGFQQVTMLELSADGASGPYLLLSHESDHAPVPARAAPGAAAAPAQSPVSAPASVPARTWLVLADKGGYSARLCDRLTRSLEVRGDRVIRAIPGSQLVEAGAGQYQLNLQDPAQYERLLSRLKGEFGAVEGIVDLYGLNTSGGGTPLLLLDQQVDRCAAAAALHRACEAIEMNATCWLVTARATSGWPREQGQQRRQPQPDDGMDTALWGFGRTLMNEASTLGIRLIDIDDAAAIDTITYSLSREICHPDAEQEVMLTASGDRYVPRLRVVPKRLRQADADSASPTLSLGFQTAGQLRNLRWEARPRVRIGRDEIEVEVQATGLNFRDIMYSLGLISDEVVEGGFAGPTLGLEFAGVVTAVGHHVRGFGLGDRVVGFGPNSFSNRVVTQAGCISPVPAGMSLEAAATIPSAFFTSYYSLKHLARLESGERILIHGAAGGVGIAAIQIAKQCGAEIFATAGSEEKRDFLRLLGVDHVFDSRSYAFADEILAITGGQGVDVVLNSLAGEAINRNLRALKPFGRFLELGKRDFQENTRIGLRPFRNNISYFGVDVDQLMKERPALTEKLFREMMQLFIEGALSPLPYQCFEAEEVIDAFRYMQQSRHIGKIVITYRKGIQAGDTQERSDRRLELPADASYLVTGGLSGFGLKTAEWLAARGARNLVLVGRTGVTTPEARDAIAALEAEGVKVHAAACDVTDARAMASLVGEVALAMPPLRGIVHAAAVIEDSLARNLGRDQIHRVLAPKVLGALNLHQLTLNKELDFFVLFSSATTLFGNPGQSSYVAANAWLEALAASRRNAGLPALCVSWGPIEDTGYLARNEQVKKALQSRMGGSALQSSVALQALEDLLLADRSGVGVLDIDWRALSRFLPTSGTPKFSELKIFAGDASADEDGSEDIRRLVARLSPEELSAAIIEMVKKEVGDILRIAPAKIEDARLLHEMGFDSLMAVELATAVEVRFGIKLPVMALGQNPTVAGLAARIVSQLTAGVEPGAQTPAASHVADQAQQLADQHAADVPAETIDLTVREVADDLATPKRIIQNEPH